jgi:OOP family OmpA-OmpF porin
MKKVMFALIAGAAFAGAAQAQTVTTNDAPRSYIGVGAATASHDYSLSGVNVNDNGGSKTSAKVFGGYEFNNTWGVEAGYTDFRKSDFSYNAGGVAGHGNSDGNAWYVAGKASVPINEQFSAFGKLGVERSESNFATNTGVSGSNNDTGVYAGVGVQYKLNQQVALTAEYERYGDKKAFGAKPDVWTVGARYSF